MCRLPFTTDHRLQSAFVLKMTDLTVDLLTLHFLVSILSFSWSWYFMAKLALSHGQAHRAQSCFMLRAFLCFAPRGREKKSEGGGTHTHTAVYSSCWAWRTNTVKILTEHTTKQTLEEQGFYGHWYLILWCRAGRTPPSTAQSVCISPTSVCISPTRFTHIWYFDAELEGPPFHSTISVHQPHTFHTHLILWCRAGKVPLPWHNQCASCPQVPHTLP